MFQEKDAPSVTEDFDKAENWQKREETTTVIPFKGAEEN